MTDLSLPPASPTAPRAPPAHLPDPAALLAKPLPALRSAFNHWYPPPHPGSAPSPWRNASQQSRSTARPCPACCALSSPTRTRPPTSASPPASARRQPICHPEPLRLAGAGFGWPRVPRPHLLRLRPPRVPRKTVRPAGLLPRRPRPAPPPHGRPPADGAGRGSRTHRDGSGAGGGSCHSYRVPAAGSATEVQGQCSGARLYLAAAIRRKAEEEGLQSALEVPARRPQAAPPPPRSPIPHSGHSDIPSLALWLSARQIDLPPSDIKRETQELLRLDKNDFCNRIFKCKLKKATLPIVDYYELLYCHWKKEMEKNKRRRVAKHMRGDKELPKQQEVKPAPNKVKSKKQPRKSTSVESSETNVTEVHQKSENQEPRPEDPPELEIDIARLFQKKEEPPKPKKKGRNKPKPKVEQTKKEKRKNSVNPECEDKTEPDLPKLENLASICSTHPSETELPQPLQPATLRQISLMKLSQELQQTSDHISEQANQYHERRIIAFERIQFLLQFYSIPIKLFGSCASGIAIKNSDIDIAIDNSLLALFHYLPEHERVRAALDRLVELFQTQAWIIQLKFIRTAAIPVIKIVVDTAVPCFHPSYGETYDRLNRPHEAGPIEADISVETLNQSQECSHLGLITTATIQKWLDGISSLHYIVILTKQLFARQRLNITYEGGLNTFAMIVLIVAYILEHNLQEQDNPALVLQSILKFYAYEFDEKTTGIDLNNHGTTSIYYHKQTAPLSSPRGKQQADLEMKDPLNQQANMSRNCYLFPVIKKLFADLLENCFEESHREVEALLRDEHEASLSVLEEKLKEKCVGRNKFSSFLKLNGQDF